MNPHIRWDRTFVLAYGKVAPDDEPFEFVGTAVYNIGMGYERKLHSLYLSILTTYNRCGIDASNYVSIVRPKFLAMLEEKLLLFRDLTNKLSLKLKYQIN